MVSVTFVNKSISVIKYRQLNTFSGLFDFKIWFVSVCPVVKVNVGGGSSQCLDPPIYHLIKYSYGYFTWSRGHKEVMLGSAWTCLMLPCFTHKRMIWYISVCWPAVLGSFCFVLFFWHISATKGSACTFVVMLSGNKIKIWHHQPFQDISKSLKIFFLLFAALLLIKS